DAHAGQPSLSSPSLIDAPSAQNVHQTPPQTPKIIVKEIDKKMRKITEIKRQRYLLFSCPPRELCQEIWCF
ncbi:MAG: hypothetical protein ACFN41_06960, partial [Hallella multisaccharivorax]